MYVYNLINNHIFPNPDKIYLGSENSLVISKVYYTEYGCTFDLRSFPFDDQKCSMNFTMESANASYIELNVKEQDITYKVLINFRFSVSKCKPNFVF